MTTSAAERGADRVDGARVAVATRLVTIIDVDAVQISFRRYYDWIARGYEPNRAHELRTPRPVQRQPGASRPRADNPGVDQARAPAGTGASTGMAAERGRERHVTRS